MWVTPTWTQRAAFGSEVTQMLSLTPQLTDGYFIFSYSYTVDPHLSRWHEDCFIQSEVCVLCKCAERDTNHGVLVMRCWATHEWTVRAQWLFIAPLTLQQHARGGGGEYPQCTAFHSSMAPMWCGSQTKKEPMGFRHGGSWKWHLTNIAAVTAGGHRQQRRLHMDTLAFSDILPCSWWSCSFNWGGGSVQLRGRKSPHLFLYFTVFTNIYIYKCADKLSTLTVMVIQWAHLPASSLIIRLISPASERICFCQLRLLISLPMRPLAHILAVCKLLMPSETKKKQTKKKKGS